jgi:hypothetical protein
MVREQLQDKIEEKIQGVLLLDVHLPHGEVGDSES